LHYLLGGLAVVASDTTGQREIASQAASAVVLYPSGEPLRLAEQLNQLLASRDRLLAAKATALRVAEEKFCWERIAPAFIQRVETVLEAA
jgi:glycosyltransferase involved in cell wall biosynthesis